MNTSVPAVRRLIMDSLRYWANDVQIDGFRFDLAATLGRDAEHEFQTDHPLLLEIIDDPQLGGREDDRRALGRRAWAAGRSATSRRRLARVERRLPRPGAPVLAHRHRDRARAGRRARSASASFAGRLAGSEGVFATERGPLASVNFVTAHDGFTLADLTAYDQKHNEGNGEDNRDGTDNNHSFNHGDEGPTTDGDHPDRAAARRCATCSARCCCRPACRCSPPATSSAAPSAATTTPTATTTS